MTMMRNRSFAGLLCVIVGIAAARGQEPAFEVASVKVNTSSAPVSRISAPEGSGRLLARGRPCPRCRRRHPGGDLGNGAHARVSCALPAARTSHQAGAAVPVAFEVALVRSNTDEAERSARRLRNASYSATNMTLRSLIAEAYLVQPFRVIGGPDWLDSDRFDIEARAPRGTPRSVYVPMLKTLLADRFTLVLHGEQRDQPIRALVRADGNAELGPNLQPSSRECPVSRRRQPGRRGACDVKISVIDGTVTIEAHGLSMIDTADMLSDVGAGPIIDRTGLTGGFDVTLSFTPETLSPALSQQLGLALQPIRYPVQFLVIDSAERPTLD